MERKFKIMLAIILVSLIMWVGSIMHYVFKSWEMDRNVLGWKDRAQVSSDAGDMYDYLASMRAGMDKYGMTEGHYALIFKTPWNDMGRDYQSVNRALERLELIKQMDRTSVEYQAGMDDVRGIIRELELSPAYWWYLHSGYSTLAVALYAMFGWLIAPVVALSAMIIDLRS